MTIRYDGCTVRDDELLRAITPNVMNVLQARGFFAALDARFLGERGESCDRTFAITTDLLTAMEFDGEAIEDVLSVLHAQGACCDCEILYNVAPESELRSSYWKARAH